MAPSEQYHQLLTEMSQLHDGKAAGYSGENPDTWANFREAQNWGVPPLQGALVRMGDKYKRAQSLVQNPSNDQVGESLKDTLMDLAAYALISICLLEEQQAPAAETPNP